MNMVEMYEKMGYSERQIEMIRKTMDVNGALNIWIWMPVIFGVVALAYMLYVRRYFVPKV
jgi:hypothetical protein